MSTKFVHEIMSTNVLIVNEEDSLAKVFDLLEEKHVSGVPVQNAAGDFTGVLSKTDLVGHKLVESIRDNHTLDEVKVKDFMNPVSPITIKETGTVEQAIELMTYKHIHRLFVLSAKGEMVGVVSTYDIVKLMSQVFKAYI